MILYKNNKKSILNKKPIKKIDIIIEEKPERPKYIFITQRDRYKFIRTCENVIHKSPEYKEYISFLKTHMDMDRCAVLKGLDKDNCKKYRIEVHHCPFTIFDIIDIVITKKESLGEPINPYTVGEEVMKLHYDEKVGLIPLSLTMHELVHNDKIFIPLQYLYQRYDLFYEEYEEYIPDQIKNKIELLINISMKCDKIQSDILDTEFVYVNIDGFDFPEIPESWGKLFNQANTKDEASNKEKQSNV